MHKNSPIFLQSHKDHLDKIFKEEYSKQVLEKKYNKTDKICQHHLECIQYH